MCDGKNHDLIAVFNQNTPREGPGTELVVRWCQICGAVVVDLDYDGRTQPGFYMKMRFPAVLKLVRPA